MLWIGQSFSSPAFLKWHLIFGFVVGIAATVLFTWILFQIEINNANYKAAVMEAQIGDRDTQLELEEETTDEANKYDDDGNHDYVQAGNEADFACSSASSRTSSPKNSSNMTDAGLYKLGDSRRRSLTRSQQITIVLHVSLLILLNYLLLVFLPGNAFLACMAMIAIWILALHSYLREELQRRQRWDRIFTMIALFFVIAGCLTLITYCRLALRDGNVYQGPARIVGYDMDLYDNSDEETLRTDVQVTWGGSWGCPDNGNRVCTATVQGALCETKYKAEDYAAGDDTVGDDSGSDRRRHHRPMKRRFLNNNDNAAQKDAAEGADGDQEEFTEEEKQEMAAKEEQDEEVYEVELDSEYEEAIVEDEEVIEEEASEELDADEEEVYDEAEDEVEEYEDELDEEYEEEVEVVEEEEEVAEEEIEEVDEVEGNSGDGDLIEENAELNKDNNELEEDLEDEEEYAEELEDEIDELTEYSYDDDAFEDEYWNNADWDAVWGEYACEDLFDGDVEGQNFNPDVPPGHDQWPTIEIYGSCNSCEAYIVDYYSSEHYLTIRLYEVQSWLYLWVGFLGLMLSAFAALREHFRTSKENEVVLLTHDGGVPA